MLIGNEREEREGKREREREQNEAISFSPCKRVVSCPAGPALIAQTLFGDISRFSWARKFNPARILAGQSELRSCIIERKS